ncbi:hypothetical protein [Aureivirga sp. CE67]|uniref:hypothetical protein n=1 Tax=Aureivirga sp. CE67 TaxID=1788983 RepID=UPI0018CA000F|nr:hypothetical protein [Aureivirga sp. CE67]
MEKIAFVNKNRMFRDMQSYLAVGYIYLIVLGIFSETLYYNRLGVNILNYSSILDVMISPIAKLTSSILGILVFILFMIMIFKFPNFLVKNKNKKWFSKLFKSNQIETDEELRDSLSKVLVFMFSIGLIGFYVGNGIGFGSKIADKIKNNEIEYDDQIIFTNDEVKKTCILGSNSGFVFYLVENNTEVHISPMNGNVRTIIDN